MASVSLQLARIRNYSINFKNLERIIDMTGGIVENITRILGTSKWKSTPTTNIIKTIIITIMIIIIIMIIAVCRGKKHKLSEERWKEKRREESFQRIRRICKEYRRNSGRTRAESRQNPQGNRTRTRREGRKKKSEAERSAPNPRHRDYNQRWVQNKQ